MQLLKKLLEKETTGAGRVAANALRAVIEIPQRIAIRGFDDTMTATLGFQREAYEDRLIEALIDPSVAKELAQTIDKVKPGVYFVSQAVSRGAFDVPLEDPQAMLDGLTVPQVGGDESIFEPIAAGPTIKPPFDPAMSPTIVPLDKDRELAMRTRGNLGGIASLA